MWRNFRCHHIADVEKSEILHIWHVCDVENVAIYAKFIAIYDVLLRNLLFTLFCREISCGEKLSPKVHLWRKMTNMRCEPIMCFCANIWPQKENRKLNQNSWNFAIVHNFHFSQSKFCISSVSASEPCYRNAGVQGPVLESPCCHRTSDQHPQFDIWNKLRKRDQNQNRC